MATLNVVAAVAAVAAAVAAAAAGSPLTLTTAS